MDHLTRKVICALDTGDLNEALTTTKRLAPFVGAFKIGHGLTMPHGLDVVQRMQDAGASRIFLDLKLHDIPNSVALGVREAAKRGVWMTTIHLTGGPAMLSAAVEEARAYDDQGPLIIGVSVLTSIDEKVLKEHLGVAEPMRDYMIRLSKLGIQAGLDGVVCSPKEVKTLRGVLGNSVIVTPGIRVASGDRHDQVRTGEPIQAIEDGADYLVIGRALAGAEDPEEALLKLGFAAVL